MQDNLSACFIAERGVTRDQIGVNLESEYFLCRFIPNKHSYFSHIFVGLPKIMLVRLNPLSRIEVTFFFLLLYFGDINPFCVILIVLPFSKDVILKYLLMFAFSCDRIE